MIHFCVATNQRPLKRQGLHCYLDLKVAIADLGVKVMYSKQPRLCLLKIMCHLRLYALPDHCRGGTHRD